MTIMKKTIFFLLLAGMNLFAMAQEEVSRKSFVGPDWLDNSKNYMLIIFSVFVIILVLRTFRNKPSA